MPTRRHVTGQCTPTLPAPLMLPTSAFTLIEETCELAMPVFIATGLMPLRLLTVEPIPPVESEKLAEAELDVLLPEELAVCVFEAEDAPLAPPVPEAAPPLEPLEVLLAEAELWPVLPPVPED